MLRAMMEQDDGARMVENVGLEWETQGTQIVECSNGGSQATLILGFHADFLESANLNNSNLIYFSSDESFCFLVSLKFVYIILITCFCILHSILTFPLTFGGLVGVACHIEAEQCLCCAETRRPGDQGLLGTRDSSCCGACFQATHQPPGDTEDILKHRW